MDPVEANPGLLACRFRERLEITVPYFGKRQQGIVALCRDKAVIDRLFWLRSRSSEGAPDQLRCRLLHIARYQICLRCL